MKVKRYKHARKTIAFYKSRFGLHEPFPILVDATFCQAAIECKIHVSTQLEKYLGGPVSLFTSPCIVEEVRKLGAAFAGAMLLNRKYEYRKCGHVVGTKSARECIKAIIGTNNKFKLFVATQDADLRADLRLIPCVPLLFIDYNAPILEQPSPASMAQSQAITSSKFAVPAHEQKVLDKLDPRPPEPVAVPKKKKPKAPNPLSCKKSKAEREAEKSAKKAKKLQKASRKAGPMTQQGSGEAGDAAATTDAGLGEVTEDGAAHQGLIDMPDDERVEGLGEAEENSEARQGTKRKPDDESPERPKDESADAAAKRRKHGKRGKKKKRDDGSGTHAQAVAANA